MFLMVKPNKKRAGSERLPVKNRPAATRCETRSFFGAISNAVAS